MTSATTIQVSEGLRVHSYRGGDGRFTAPVAPVDPSNHPVNHRDPQALLLVLFHGAGFIRYRDRLMSVTAGSLCFLPGDHPVTFGGFDDGGLVIVELPSEVSARARDSINSATGRAIAADSGAAAFLRSFVDTLDEQLPGYRPEHSGWIQTSLCDMAERVLSECAAPYPTPAARATQAAKTFILTHLTDVDLVPHRVAREAAVSLRTLNRLFAAEGGSVGGWIRNQRLERCRADLHDPCKVHRSIGQIGAMWGFLDAAHFSRTFKDAFGCSPRAYRAAEPAVRRGQVPAGGRVA